MPLPNVKSLCEAHSRRSGKPCQNAAMQNGRCRMHGGASPVSFGSPRFTHGQYCKSLGGRITGLGTVAFRDTIRHEPEKLRRIEGGVTARLVVFGGAWMHESAAREELRKRGAIG